MLKIVRHLKDVKWLVLVIVGLLIVQAYCDLALPQYMSDIVDVGLSRGGIAEVAPNEMRASTLENLSLFMSEADASYVREAYRENADGNLTLAVKDRETLDRLADALTGPMLGLIGMRQMGVDIEAAKQGLAAGAVTREQMQAQLEQGMAQLGDTGEMIKSAAAAQFVSAEYEALGVDTGAIQTRYILFAGLKMIGMTLIVAVCAILAGLIASRIAARMGMNLRGQVFHKVVSFSNGDIEKFSTASLITRTTNDIQQVQFFAVMMLRMVIYAPIIGVGGVLKVIGTRTNMGWIIAVGVAVVMLLVGVIISISIPKIKKMQGLIDRINLISREILSGLQVIRAFGRADHENKRFEVANTNLMKTQLFTNRVMTMMMPAIMFIMNVLTLGIVWFGTHGIDTGTMQLGSMMAFMTYAIQILMSFLMLTMVFAVMPRAVVSAERVDEVLATEASVVDREALPAESRTDFTGRVSFEHVSFRYPDAEQDVLADITFEAQPGKTTAIIGSTGSGKSTLLNLIPRFYDVTGGAIKIDGVDIRDLSQNKLRGLLGYVPQRGVLFSGTIESNLKFGGDGITDEAMQQAAEIAQAADFIGAKPEQYNDPIAQGGTNVSGGQKQRLSIARAIAKNPKILLFDDSFSALDFKTDVKLRRALSEKVAGTTILIVAQRISTVLHADQIVVLDEGRAVGIGTHESLMENCRMYQEIARSQLSEAELKGGKGA